MSKKNKTYEFSVGFYSMEVIVTAKDMPEARRKMKAAVRRKAVSHINPSTTFVEKINKD